jgi:uncharacterized Ntn-hydrolase superfamily protein
MTWSIIARDPADGSLGIAVTTKFFAVGAMVPYGLGRVGVVATQAFVNPLIGHDGLRLMAEGCSPELALAVPLKADTNAAIRQAHAIDASGLIAQHTGAECVDWCGHVKAENVSVAGNMLAGPAVVEATLATYLAQGDLGFSDRLIAALAAGQAEGGDTRGRQSAALRIWRDEPYPLLDIRVDDHPDPIVELTRLHEVAFERYIAFREAAPTRMVPAGNPDRTWVDRRSAELVAARGR